MYLSRFKTNYVFHRYDKRNMSYLLITSHNTKFEQSIPYSGMLIYNKTSNEIKRVMCIVSSRKYSINYLLERSFYSVEEFMTIDPQPEEFVYDIHCYNLYSIPV